MDDEERARWRRVEELLDDLWDEPPAQRSARLAEIRAEDPALHAELERLLDADRHAEAFLAEPAGNRIGVPLSALLQDAVQAAPDARYGPYRVDRLLGTGGMGRVYEGCRAEGDFEQRVAIKILDAARDSDAARERFRRERRILARLEHPHIARLLDGGVTDEGLPWFAMELVTGTPITRHCEARTLPVAARIALFEQVCEAVGEAHRNLVVHRDLKPSNILVSESGEVKLLDFGIAKLFEEEESDPGLTRTGVRPMTPSYAAPEQIRGEPVTTATDIWALGAVLHELLTGRRPFEGATSGELERAILEEDLTGLSRTRASGDLRGDLRTIVAKAMEKAPGRRYPTVEALHEDVRRARTGRPVLARPATLGYRASRFLRRYRWQSAAAGTVLLAVALGTAGTAWQARRAGAQATRSERMLEFLTGLFELSDPARARGQELTAREILDRGSGKADSAFADDPPSRAELLLILGDLQHRLGFYASADSLLALATLRAEEAYGAESPEVGRALNARGSTLTELGDLDTAERLLEQALSVNRASAGRRAAETGVSLNNLAAVHARRGDYDRAIAMYREAVEIDVARYGANSPELATDLNNLARALENTDRFDEADSLHRRALDLRVQAYGESHPDVAVSLGNLARLKEKSGEWEEAEQLYRRAIAIYRLNFPEGHPDLAEDLTNLAQMLQGIGRAEEAYALLEEAVEVNRRMLGPDHPEVARDLSVLAANAYFRGDYPAALDGFTRALEAWRASSGEDHPSTVATLHNRGFVLLLLGRLTEARADLEAAWEARRRLYGDEHWDTAWAERSLARLRLEEGDLAGAEQGFAHALSVFRATRGADHHSVAEALLGLGWTRIEAGRPGEAEEDLREAERIWAAAFGADDRRTREARVALGVCLTESDRREEGTAILRADLPRLEDQIGATQRACRRARAALARSG